METDLMVQNKTTLQLTHKSSYPNSKLYIIDSVLVHYLMDLSVLILYPRFISICHLMELIGSNDRHYWEKDGFSRMKWKLDHGTGERFLITTNLIHHIHLGEINLYVRTMYMYWSTFTKIYEMIYKKCRTKLIYTCAWIPGLLIRG